MRSARTNLVVVFTLLVLFVGSIALGVVLNPASAQEGNPCTDTECNGNSNEGSCSPPGEGDGTNCGPILGGGCVTAPCV